MVEMNGEASRKRKKLTGRPKGSKNKPRTSKPAPRMVYSEAIALEICARIADGDSLRTISADPAMPCKRTILTWQRANEEFAAALEEARQHRADARIEEIADIAEQV